MTHARFAIATVCALLACEPAAAPLATTPDAPEVAVVGTIHGGHLKVEGYPLAALDALIGAFSPELVLVEIRPEPFATGHLEDGPIEMTYVTLAAKRRGIRVVPIDWWREEDFGAPSPADGPLASTFARDYGSIAEAADSFGSFEEVNSQKRVQDVLTVVGARARLDVGDEGPWHRRQAWFHEQAWSAIRTTHAKRVMAFVGFFHRPELQAFLGGMGARIDSPLGIVASAAPHDAPDDVLAEWRSGLERLRAAKQTAPAAMASSFDRKIALWEQAIARKGRCCIP